MENLAGLLVIIWLIDHYLFDGSLGCIFGGLFHDNEVCIDE